MNSMEIYYADDDADDVEIFSLAMNEIIENRANVALNVYSSGVALLDDFEKRPPKNGIVFLDINMPAKDGFQTLMEIRNEKRLQIPIVMYSTSSETVFVKKSIEHGANRYVIKPINFQDLKKILQKVIDINWDENSVDEENFVVRL